MGAWRPAPWAALAGLLSLGALGGPGGLGRQGGGPVACHGQHALSESEYYAMPELFTLEEWARCLAPPGGLYCLGTFELLPPAPATAGNGTALRLYRRLQDYSKNTLLHFNRTRVHRGVCVSSSCAAWQARQDLEPAAPPALPAAAAAHEERAARVFAACVDARTRAAHGLDARLLRLEYCARHGQRAHPPPDVLDALVLALLGALLALPALATAYHYLVRRYRAPEVQWVLAWSVARNWRRLVAADAGTGTTPASDPRLQRLRAINGMKAISMVLVQMAHAAMVQLVGYVHNPRRVEQAADDPTMVLLFNGTVIIQTFFVISSFLLTYKTLIYLETHPDINNGTFFLKGVADRVARVSPMLLVVGAYCGSVAAWAGDGPMWPLLVGAERDNCRANFWLFLLYLHNVLHLDAKCLPQTWYLAADMHLYCALLALLVWTRRWTAGRRARCLAALYAAALLAHFLLAYCLRLKPALLQQEPEQVHALHAHNASFAVMYQSTLANVCGALTGAALALLQLECERRRLQLRARPLFVWACRAALPALAAWLLMGYFFLLRLEGRAAPALYAALEKPGFALIVAVLLLACMHQVDGVCRDVLEWDGWRVLSRLSLAALLVHTVVLRAAVGLRHQPTHVHTFSTIMEWAATSVLTYLASVPLVLAVEYPALSLYQLVVRRLTAPATPAPAPAPSPPAPPPPLPAAPHGKRAGCTGTLVYWSEGAACAQPPAQRGGLRALIRQWDAQEPRDHHALRKRQ